LLNGGDSGYRSGGEHDERPSPSDRRGNRRHELDRYHRQEKPNRGLNGERGADSMRWNSFGYENAKLGRISDDEETPDQ
jgi:hypothetical protein